MLDNRPYVNQKEKRPRDAAASCTRPAPGADTLVQRVRSEVCAARPRDRPGFAINDNLSEALDSSRPLKDGSAHTLAEVNVSAEPIRTLEVEATVAVSHQPALDANPPRAPPGATRPTRSRGATADDRACCPRPPASVSTRIRACAPA